MNSLIEEKMFRNLIKSLVNLLIDLFNSIFNKLCELPFSDKLWITDLRTFRVYTIPVRQNVVLATDFRKISPLSPWASYQEHLAKGLTLLDPGFRNTAVRESSITYMYENKVPFPLNFC